MSNNTASAILQAIYNTLTASPSLAPSTLKQIRIGVDADTSTGFPFCRIYLVDFSSPIADTISYERQFSFNVEILQEFTNKSKENAELDFCTAIDAVMNRLNGTWQLGIGVEKSVIETSAVRTVELSGAPMRVATIRFTVTTLVQNPA